jgi:hypothetical protein
MESRLRACVPRLGVFYEAVLGGNYFHQLGPQLFVITGEAAIGY